MVSKHCFAAPDAPNVAAVLDELALVGKSVEFMIRTRPMPSRSERQDGSGNGQHNSNNQNCPTGSPEQLAVPSLLPNTAEQAFVSGV